MNARELKEMVRQAAGLAEMQKFAEERGGVCLASEYKDNKTKLDFKCKNLHTFKMRPFHIKSNHWCMQCHQTVITLKTCQEFAVSLGGKCLSTTYKNNVETMSWECSNGHQWRAQFHDVKDHGRWCTTCTK